MRAEAANDPAAPQLHKGVGAAHGMSDDRLVENLRGSGMIAGPIAGGGHQGFGFASDAATVPFGNRDETLMSEAAESSNAVDHAVGGNVAGRHQMLDGFDCADGNFALPGRQTVHFHPEANWVAQFVFRDLAKPLVVFAEDEWSSLFAHAFAVAFENGIANVFFFDGQVSRGRRQVRAHGQANQVIGVGHGVSFVKIVDAPDQAALDVAPRAEVLDMQVAHGEHTRAFRQLRTNLGPYLRPTVVRGPQERKDFGFHVLVFEAKVRLDDLGVVAEPVFKLARGFDDVHSEATIARAGLGSQTRRTVGFSRRTSDCRPRPAQEQASRESRSELAALTPRDARQSSTDKGHADLRRRYSTSFTNIP